MQLHIRRARDFIGLDDADDFDVLDAARRVGRLYYRPGVDLPWRWSLSLSITAQRLTGRAPTRVEALHALKEVYEREVEGQAEDGLTQE